MERNFCFWYSEIMLMLKKKNLKYFSNFMLHTIIYNALEVFPKTDVHISFLCRDSHSSDDHVKPMGFLKC